MHPASIINQSLFYLRHPREPRRSLPKVNLAYYKSREGGLRTSDAHECHPFAGTHEQRRVPRAPDVLNKE